MIGYKFSEEARKKISEANKGNKNGRGNKGRTFTEEHRKNISLAKKGKPKSSETRLKLSNYWKGKQIPGRWKRKTTNINKVQVTKRTDVRPKPLGCELCGAERRIVFDHNHVTGKFRGWLCNSCNIVLGLVKEDKRTLWSLVEYLENDGIKN